MKIRITTLCLIFFLSSSLSYARTYIASGTVCGYGKTRAESLSHFNKILRQDVINLAEDSATNYQGPYLRAPFQLIGEMAYEKKSWIYTYQHVSCQIVKGVIPNVHSRETEVNCRREASLEEIRLSISTQMTTFRSSHSEKQNCSPVPGSVELNVFSCINSKNALTYLHYDQDRLELLVSRFDPIKNRYQTVYRADCR